MNLNFTSNDVWSLSPELVQAYNDGACFDVHIDMTLRCKGGCTFCFMSSTDEDTEGLSTQKILELIDDSRQIGAKKITWYGGEPFLRKDWAPIVEYAHEQGMINDIRTGCQPLHDRQLAQQIVDMNREGIIQDISLHFDSVNRHDFMKTRETYDAYYDEVMQGIWNLVNLGYPKTSLSICIVQTTANLGSFRETVDWSIDKLGLSLRSLKLTSFRPCGLGENHPELECSTADLKKNFEYLCQLHGWNIETTPSLHECSKYYCGSMLHIEGNGEVVPCSMMHRVVGNVNEARFKDIFRHHKETLLLFDLRDPDYLKGRCRVCSNHQFCFGCRANAYNYLKDARYNDPKCWVKTSL